MSLSHHQQRQLHRIESDLLGADPQLAAMLFIFAKLAAGQAMPSWEQVPGRRDRVRQAAGEPTGAARDNQGRQDHRNQVTAAHLARQ